MTRSQKIAQHISAAIIRNTRKRWSGLHTDAISALESEIIMSNKTSCVTSSMNVKDTPLARIQPGREIPDSPADLAQHAPGKLAAVTTSSPTAPAKPASGENTRPAGMVAQMNCDPHTLGVVIRPVDRKTITGSTPGDWRSKPGDTARASVARATDNGGPRQPMGQFKNSRNAPDKPGFQSTVMTTGEEAGD